MTEIEKKIGKETLTRAQNLSRTHPSFYPLVKNDQQGSILTKLMKNRVYIVNKPKINHYQLCLLNLMPELILTNLFFKH